MHGIAKRGLALVAATSGLVLGSATLAAAHTTSTADVTRSGGVVAGWAAQVPATVPVKLCGDDVQAGAVKEGLKGSDCKTGPEGAKATAHVDKSGGIGSGNAVQATASAPVLFCGWNVNAASAEDFHKGTYCAADEEGSGASATADVDKSGGILSGNAVQAVLNVPIDFCGNNVTALTFGDRYEGSACTD